MLVWHPIDGFPGYSISNTGAIRNDRTDRILRQSDNTRGIPIVGLVRQGVQHKRSIPVLVAKAFAPEPPNDAFNTVIHLDGDRTNYEASNLAWRPLWFARNYAQQFTRPPLPRLGPVLEIGTGTMYETTWDAAIANGLIEANLRMSINARQPIWPTRQLFALGRPRP